MVSKSKGGKKGKRKGIGESLTSTLLSSPHGSKKPLTSEEKKLLNASDQGNIPIVRELLQNNPNIDISVTDLLGRTPLYLAIGNEHLEIVEMLLEHVDSSVLPDALLYAISLDHDDIAELIIKHPSYTTCTEEFLVSSESGTTPLILAAQRNSYEIVSLLVHQGEKIVCPHGEDCTCERCQQCRVIDELRFAKSRLNAYKGLASEAYICLTSDDPILTAFEMRRTLSKVATKEKHYRQDYEELALQLGEFVVKLLDNVKDNRELDIILNETAGESSETDLARLNLALKLDEKWFVAHPSIQKKLTSLWYGDLHLYRHHFPQYLQVLSYVMLPLSLPILTFIYWIYPSPAIHEFLNIPFVKFTGQTTSFFLFLILIVTISLDENPTQDFDTGKPSTLGYLLRSMAQQRGMNLSLVELPYQVDNITIRAYQPTGMQIFICIFVAGLIWQECKQLYSNGLGDHFDSLFNFVDFFSLKLYVASLVLKLLSFRQTYLALEYFLNIDRIKRAYDGDPDARYYAYWLRADRFYWDSFDPCIVAEGLFAVANVLSFVRLFYLLAVNEQLGPLQVSLNRMMLDILKFMAIFFIVFIAFFVALNNLYWYYQPSVRQKVEIDSATRDIETNAGVAFGTVESTLNTMFWALFGMSDADVVELDGFNSDFTVRVGYLVYGAYIMATVIVLLNMLIAMMSRSFDTIQGDEALEWKFARAQLYMEYVRDESFIQVPLNLVPSSISIYRAVKSLLKYTCPCLNNHCTKGKESDMKIVDSSSNLGNNLNVDAQTKHTNLNGSSSPAEDSTRKKTIFQRSKSLIKSEDTYTDVIRQVIKRFIIDEQSGDDSVEGEIEDLKQDLSSFRFEVTDSMNLQAESVKELLIALGVSSIIDSSIGQSKRSSSGKKKNSAGSRMSQSLNNSFRQKSPKKSKTDKKQSTYYTRSYNSEDFIIDNNAFDSLSENLSDEFVSANETDLSPYQNPYAYMSGQNDLDSANEDKFGASTYKNPYMYAQNKYHYGHWVKPTYSKVEVDRIFKRIHIDESYSHSPQDTNILPNSCILM